MSGTRGLLRLALPALLMQGLWGCASKKDQVVIFATARTQGRLWSTASPGGGAQGGFAVFRSLYAAEKLPKLALDGGGWFGGTPEGFLTRGRSTIAALSAVPYSAAAAGYDDLSLPPKELQKLAASSSAPVVCANLYFKDNKKTGFVGTHALLPLGGTTAGVFSVALADPARPDRQKQLANYKLERLPYDADLAMKALRAGGAKVFVLLVSVNPRMKATPELLKAFLEKMPKVDLVIVDDPGIRKMFRAGHAYVAPAGLGMNEASKITLDLDPATGKLAGAHCDLLPLDAAKYGEDPDMLKVTGAFKKASDAHFLRRIGNLAEPLPLSENGLSPAAEFAADCIRTWSRSNAAIVGNDEPAAGFSSGPVTVADLYRAFPLDSSVVFVKIRGDDLEDVLAGLQPGEVSVSGLKLFMKDGALERAETDAGPLVPGKVYHVAVPDSLVNGRETTVLSSAMEFANSKRFLREIAGWCFSSKKITSRRQGARVVRSVNASATAK